MTDRIVLIESACSLSVRDEQLVVDSKTDGERTIPLEDLSFLLIDCREVTFTAPVVDGVTRYGAVVAVCDGAHVPSCIVMPLHGNVVQTERLRLQASLPEGRKDAVWEDIVRTKIRNQADLLDFLSLSGGEYVRRKAEGSGVSGREGVAADIYWKRLFGDGFRRDRFGSGPNPLLNYGYAVLRAAAVRSLLCAGLHPSIGLYHKGRYDDFPLADDVMEPFRVFVDREVYEMWREGVRQTDKEARRRLVSILHSDVRSGERTVRLDHALSSAASSLLAGMRDGEALVLPRLC